MTQTVSHRLLIAELMKLCAEGHTMAEAAQIAGLSYHYVGILARRNGIKFKRPYTKSGSKAERNKEICRRYLAGEQQNRLGEEFGITRERVRQIIEKAGLVSETKRHADFMATVAGAVARKSLTIGEAAAMFDINRMNVYNYCREHGVKPASRTAEEIAELDRLAEMVISGASLRKASDLDHSKAEKLRRHLKSRGIKARGRSRHDDFTKRKELLNDWRDAGFTWAECAKKLAKHDGRPIGGGGLYVWAQRHMPHLFPSLNHTGEAA